MIGKQYKKYSGLLIASTFITLLTSVNSYAVCNYQNVNDAILKVRQTQTGGPAATAQGKDYIDPVVQNARNVIQQSVDAGCSNLGPEWQSRDYMGNDGTRTNAQFAPVAPGDSTNTSNSDIYTSTQAPANDKSSSAAPQNFTNAKITATTGNKTSASSPASGLSCGGIAAQYGQYLSTLGGPQTPTYKAGCAGTSADNTVRSSPDNTGQVCNGNQFGQFGLVQGAYNNKYQGINVSSLATATPAATTGNVIASNNNATGVKNEPNGCRLTNYSACGQVGDIIMVQSKLNAKATDPYDAYMIYAGDNQFYQVQNNGGKAVVKSSLPSQYAGATYAAVRESCSTSTASN